MKTTQALIKQNNQLREKLTVENEKYYSEILVYLRLSTKNELATEEILMDILQDILQAQENGTTAEEYFGKEPKKVCDDIMQQLPHTSLKEKLSYLWLGISVLAFILLFNLIRFFDAPTLSISIFKVACALIFITLAVLYLLHYIRQNNFMEKSNWKTFISLWFIFVLFIGALVLIYLFVPEIGMLTFTKTGMLAIYVLLFTVALIGVWQTKMISFWLVYLIMLSYFLTVQLQLLPQEFLVENQKLITLIISISCFIIFMLEPLWTKMAKK